MPFTPTGGPAFLNWNGLTLQMHDDWLVNDEPEHFDVVTNLQGRVAQGMKNVTAKIRFTPVAYKASLADLFAKLQPYTPNQRGRFAFPSTPLPAVIQTADGKRIEFKNAALTGQPDMTFAPTAQLFGQAELTCLIHPDAAADDAEAFVEVTSSAYAEPELDPLDILFDTYTLSYGDSPSAPFDDIVLDESGLKFTSGLNVTPRTHWKKGIHNYQISDVTASVRFRPENIDAAEWYATLMRVQGTGMGIGRLRGTLAAPLTLTGTQAGSASLTFPLAAADRGGLAFASSAPRSQEVTMQIHRKAVSGVLQPLFTLGVV